MKIPLLDITILSINSVFLETDPACKTKQKEEGIKSLTHNKNNMDWKIETIKGEEYALPPVYEKDTLDFKYLKSRFQWVFKAIKVFGNVFLSSFAPKYTETVYRDDELAAETVYIDYLRVSQQSEQGFEGLYKDLKEVVRPIIITNVNLCQSIESDIRFHGNAINHTNDKYTMSIEDVADDGTITKLKYITHEPNDLQTRIRSFDMKSVNGVDVSYQQTID